MKIKNGKLLEITEADIHYGIFENSEITELADKCFNSINNVKKIILPNCTTFGSGCFYSNDKLTSVTLNKATTFGSYCFRYNHSLTSVTLNKATTFGSYCFRYNHSLTSVTLNKATTFGSDCFGYNHSLTSVTLNKATTFGSFCFYSNDKLTSVTLNKATTFGSCCFYSNDKLTIVTLNKATTFGSDCFRYNRSLTSVTLNKATTFGSDCFYSNDKLTSVTLNKFKLKIKSVDGYCFVIENTKSTKGIHIYTGYNFIELKKGKIVKQECFVAEKGKFTAHGETVKKAIQDLEFKIISEKLKNEPIKKDTIITIQYYHSITGACELGIKDWMKSNGIKDKIKAIDLLPILKKTNAYGFEKFKQLYSK